MLKISNNLANVRSRIQLACKKCHRNPNEVTLLAVSKKKTSEDIEHAFLAGQRAFGESYLQEALKKQQDLNALAIDWHFIGPIQSNKTRDISTHFNWVHSVDRPKIAQRLNDQRPENLPPLNVFIQVNLDNEASKSGCTLDQLESLAHQMSQLPNLQLRGLMSIPQKQKTKEEQQASFERLAQLQNQLQKTLNINTMNQLSIGMSSDLEAAITAGSTLVRIGTDIFGQRP